MTLAKVNVCARPECGLPIRSRGLCNKHYEAHRNRMIAYGRWESKLVPAGPVRDHYQALLAAGMHRNQIARISGIKADQLDNLHRPRKDRGATPCKQVARTTRDRLLAIPVPAPCQAWRWAADGAYVDGTGTSRRLRALVALGWTQRTLAARLDIHEANIGDPMSGTRLVTAGLARKVAALFDELQLTPGPSKRATLRAARNGWAPPLAWDEDTIDDPDATPTTDQPHEDADNVAVDHVAVDRGITWLHSRPGWNKGKPEFRQWMAARPDLTRDEKLAIADQLADTVTRSILCGALNLRPADLTEQLKASS